MWRPAALEHAGRMYRKHRSYSCDARCQLRIGWTEIEGATMERRW